MEPGGGDVKGEQKQEGSRVWVTDMGGLPETVLLSSGCKRLKSELGDPAKKHACNHNESAAC